MTITLQISTRAENNEVSRFTTKGDGTIWQRTTAIAEPKYTAPRADDY